MREEGEEEEEEEVDLMILRTRFRMFLTGSHISALAVSSP